MYILLEYATYILVVVVLGLVLFGASALALVTKAGTDRLAEKSHQIARTMVESSHNQSALQRFLHRHSPSNRQA